MPQTSEGYAGRLWSKLGSDSLVGSVTERSVGERVIRPTLPRVGCRGSSALSFKRRAPSSCKDADQVGCNAQARRAFKGPSIRVRSCKWTYGLSESAVKSRSDRRNCVLRSAVRALWRSSPPRQAPVKAAAAA